MALSSEDERTYHMMVMQMQRDINCLTDPDRSVRRRAVDKLSRALKSESSHVSVPTLRVLCTSNLKRPLLRCAENDVVEKCRERALDALLFLCERGALELSDATLNELVALADVRLGRIPYPEPTEEIRLLILQLLYAFLKQFAAKEGTSKSLCDVITELANALGKSLVDPFPEAKKMSADCVILISKTWKSSVGMQMGTIARSLVINLGHQHSRVRTCALQALEAAVPCCSEALLELLTELLMPAVRKVVFDHAPSVRKQLVVTLAAWLSQINQVQQFDKLIFPAFLAGITDESPEVRELSIAKMNEISTIWETRDGSEAVDENDMIVDEKAVRSTPPLYFQSRPPIGARKLAIKIQAQVLPWLLEKTGDWTSQVRERYTQILSAYLILLEQNMNPFIETVFAALGKICRDDEEGVITSVKACSGVIGYYADIRIVLASLLPMVTGRLVGQETAQYRIIGLTLLGMSIKGMATKTIEAHLEQVTEALCDAHLRESEVADLHDQLASVISSIVFSAGPLLEQKDEICFRLFWVLNHLLASSSKASESLEGLAVNMKHPIEMLYVRYMKRILSNIAPSTLKNTSWQKSKSSRVLFDSLCRRGGRACGENLDKIIPVILVYLEPEHDADIRLAFLSLLETMLGMNTISKALMPFNVALLQKAIIPNITCREGRVAATIRKVGVACAYTLFRQDIADQKCLFETAPQMLLVLKSSIDDSDPKTRQLVCLALQYLFVAFPECLREEPVHQLNAEILKRLDDSNDTVRRAACETFFTLLKAAPREHFRGTIIDYMLDCLFVHLDDTEPFIQEAVLKILQEIVAIDALQLAKKAKENRSRHQSSRFCDHLLALATAWSQVDPAL
ncbi:uncharacterized protein CCR75_001536 [Bremia lactucae]|uniref:TOG domain-containing protein n=1 Tax=Bremia lactucae TaxID=4779 RepID=A0A976I9V8_BRELC|nr:hypothetical protein CCR75_001536 [Bremia lactucae]